MHMLSTTYRITTTYVKMRMNPIATRAVPRSWSAAISCASVAQSFAVDDAKKVSIASVVRRKRYTASLGKHVSVRKHSGRGAWSKSNTAMTPYMKVKSTVTTSIGTIMVRLMLMQRSIIIGVSHMGSTRKTWSERNEKMMQRPAWVYEAHMLGNVSSMTLYATKRMTTNRIISLSEVKMANGPNASSFTMNSPMKTRQRMRSMYIRWMGSGRSSSSSTSRSMMSRGFSSVPGMMKTSTASKMTAAEMAAMTSGFVARSKR